ncbi:MAG TPA: hypothetical protein VF772_02075 [Terriglobales bacterium]
MVTYEGKFYDARDLAQKLNKDIYISPSGQNVFPVYGASGALLAIYVFYLKDRDVEWPVGAVDLGRESTVAEFRHKGIYAIEVTHDMDMQAAFEHAQEVVTREQR